MMVSRALVSATLLFLGTACSNGSTAPKGESDSGPTFSDYTVYTDRSVPAAANDQALVDKGTPARDQGLPRRDQALPPRDQAPSLRDQAPPPRDQAPLPRDQAPPPRDQALPPDQGVVDVVKPAPSIAQYLTTLHLDRQKIINHDVIGLGINVDMALDRKDYSKGFSGGSWRHGEWSTKAGDIHSQGLPNPSQPQEWDNFFELLRFMTPAYIRLGISYNFFEPFNDDNNPSTFNDTSGFLWSPGFAAKHPQVPQKHYVMLSMFYRVLDFCQQNGIPVQIANWNLGTTAWVDDYRADAWRGVWLSKWVHEVNAGRQSVSAVPSAIKQNPGIDIPYNTDEFVESMAAILRHLIVEKKYTVIKSVSFFNEPEGFGQSGSIYSTFYSGINPDPQKQQKRVHHVLGELNKRLATRLTQIGIRKSIDIIGFDGAGLWAAKDGYVDDRTAKLISESAGQVDLISLHNYTSDFDYKLGTIASPMQDTLTNQATEWIKTVLRDIALSRLTSGSGRARRMIWGEFGAHSYPHINEGSVSDMLGAKQMFTQRLHSAQGLLATLNHGGKAALLWHLNDNYHRKWRHLTFESNTDPTSLAYTHYIPEPVSYYAFALIAKLLGSGADIYRTSLSGTYLHRIRAVGAKTAGGGNIILLTNDAFIDLGLSISGIASGDRYHVYYVSQKRHDHLYQQRGDITKSSNRLALPARSIVVLSTKALSSFFPAGHYRPAVGSGFEVISSSQVRYRSYQADGSWTGWTTAHPSPLTAEIELAAGRLLLFQNEYLETKTSRPYMQSDGNLVLYRMDNGRQGQALWSTATNNRGHYAMFQDDGNFVVYDRNGQATFSTATNGATRIRITSARRIAISGGPANWSRP
jgi:hypothetical protein